MENLSSCIVCNGKHFRFITSSGKNFSGEKVRQCSACGLVFLSPRMSAAEMEQYYKGNEFSVDFRGAASPDEKMVKFREQRANEKIALLRKYLPETLDLPVLEIGCSSGYVLNKLNALGYKVQGIDPSSGFVAAGVQMYGLDMSAGLFPEDLPATSPPEYGAIIGLHVIEHVHDPIKFIEASFSRLAAGGRLILEVPDIDRATSVRTILHDEYFQKSHVWDFSAHTLSALLTQSGFDMITVDHYSSKKPNDKHVLLVAEKPNPHLTKTESKTAQEFRRPTVATKLFLSLRVKLFLGKIASRMKALARLAGYRKEIKQ